MANSTNSDYVDMFLIYGEIRQNSAIASRLYVSQQTNIYFTKTHCPSNPYKRNCKHVKMTLTLDLADTIEFWMLKKF